jgi:hypothetical protein
MSWALEPKTPRLAGCGATSPLFFCADVFCGTGTPRIPLAAVLVIVRLARGGLLAL